MSNYKGNRWYKCDFHLHTMSSKCYIDKANTPEQWVDRAIEQGLTAVAVTDHNDYRGIAPIMEAAGKRGLPVFPGVEITCDTSKMHMLILFDINKNADTVRDFLNRCDIDSDCIGKSDGTSMSIFEVCEIAKKRGAMVIAAHIDEFNAINSMNPINLERLLTPDYVDAVQVANLATWRQYRQTKDADQMIETLQTKYGPGATPEEIDRWRKCFERADKAGIPMLAFSDNQNEPDDSHHGLWGIGSNYTWIKMDETVDLESINQSLITPASRIRMMIDSPEEPKTEPDYWIMSMELRKTELNPHQPIHLDFHPQLNCIVGGQGSGKSAIIETLSGVYKTLESSLLRECIADLNTKYALHNDYNSGMFNAESEVEIIFKWFGQKFKLLVTDIKDMSNQSHKLYEINEETGEETPYPIGEYAISSLFGPNILIGNQMTQMARTPSAFMNFIDNMMPDMYLMHRQSDYFMNRIIDLSLSRNTFDKALADKPRIQAEANWLRGPQKNDKFLTEERKAKFKNRIAIRDKSLALLESCDKGLTEAEDKLNQYIEAYENNRAAIRDARQKFIDEVLANDAHYKVEVVPYASRDSLHAMLEETLGGDINVMREDTRKLEELLFAKNDGRVKYADALKSLRGGVDQNGFSEYFTHVIRSMSVVEFEELVHFYPKDALELSYRPPEKKKYFSITNGFLGEKVRLMLAFVISASELPLIIDQPEDAIDNRIIYEEVLPKFKVAKQNRQLIMTTFNSNLATNGDAEMIIVMSSTAKFKKVSDTGTLDSGKIRKELCTLLEGTPDAFIQRNKKYQTEYF